MVKHTQIICWQQPTNCLNVFDHFLWLALKGLSVGCLGVITQPKGGYESLLLIDFLIIAKYLGKGVGTFLQAK